MTEIVSLRRAGLADLAAVDLLLSRSYPKLLSRDYPPSMQVLAIPRIARARPELLASGTYFLAEDGTGRVIAAGGWTRANPAAAGGQVDIGHVRHVATDPAVVRRGVGRALMTQVMADARDAGMLGLDCLSTLTAVPFYAALGFHALYSTEARLAPGISFPVMRMMADLCQTTG